MFRFDRKYIYVIIAVMILWFLTSITGERLLSLILTIPGVLIAMTFHEFAHAKAADILGDDTPRIQGRLNLNPFSHIDPIGFAMLILAGFGWGKPVEINSRNFNRNMELTKAEAIVAIAGPLMNFVVALVFLIIYAVMCMFCSIETNQIMFYIAMVVNYVAVINIGLGIFNLIPLPPLDGSKVLMHFLPYNARNWFEENERYFYIGFLIIFITGMAGNIITPLITGTYSGMLALVSKIFMLFA